MTYIGIDPGKSGAIACVHVGYDDTSVTCCKLSDTEHDIANWLQVTANFGPAVCRIEKVHAMPGQGVVSMFTFGQSYGFLRGLLVSLRIPFEEVTPAKWQAAMGCRTKGDKNVSKAKAQQLFPNLKVTHAIADALLIAEYARRTA